MKLFVALALVVAVTMVPSGEAAGSLDFACGEMIRALCGGLPHDQVKECLRRNRDRLSRPCHEKIIEDEAFDCGLAVEKECGAARKNGTEAFHKCIKEHDKVFEEICPEKSKDRRVDWDEQKNIKCGWEVEEYCSPCKDRACVKKCIEALAEKTTECGIAFHEKANFECGIEFEVECGKSRELGPIELVRCIEERHPCAARN